MGKENTLLGEGIKIWSKSIGVAVAAESGAEIFGDDPEDVGLLKSGRLRFELAGPDFPKFHNAPFAVMLDCEVAFELFFLSNVGDGVSINEGLNAIALSDHAEMIPLAFFELCPSSS